MEILQQPEDDLWIIRDAPWGIVNTPPPEAGVNINTPISGLWEKSLWLSSRLLSPRQRTAESV